MQIFNDKKKRIGTLHGFRERAITTTLDSGDKELTFEYPANGKLVNLLKEEYYIQTKTDEFVLKAVETGEQFNKYTAVLNVEELEGTPFPYGFESQEQTIKACLEFAFEGTGWTVRTCTVTKKRTINEEESVTAWDVLQKCLSTYRCECVIDSLNKAIDIYEQIGSDKGCYFMEGLNLKKLTPKSDTYEFYTRIYPIGKDGITPEWMTGKSYIDNFQYSSKVKTYVWRDERYTNTTSLIEDATAKLEEMSRPQKTFTAEVADLAKISKKHKNVLSYKIGDTVTLVSKKTKTREKQRIVKITEYPETPQKNIVEISNAKKTFAQIQQEETESAREEAVSISNRTTKKILANYSTTEEIETKIAASKEAVELGVMHTLQNYYDKTETDALITISKGEIIYTVSEKVSEAERYACDMAMTAENNANSATDEKLEDYSTTEEVESIIKQTANGISSEVSKKVGTDEIISKINQTAEEILISAKVIDVDGVLDVEKLNALEIAAGSVLAENIKGTTISGKTVSGGKIVQNASTFNFAIEGGELTGGYTNEGKSWMDFTNRVSGVCGAQIGSDNLISLCTPKLYVGTNSNEVSKAKTTTITLPIQDGGLSYDYTFVFMNGILVSSGIG